LIAPFIHERRSNDSPIRGTQVDSSFREFHPNDRAFTRPELHVELQTGEIAISVTSNPKNRRKTADSAESERATKNVYQNTATLN